MRICRTKASARFGREARSVLIICDVCECLRHLSTLNVCGPLNTVPRRERHSTRKHR